MPKTTDQRSDMTAHGTRLNQRTASCTSGQDATRGKVPDCQTGRGCERSLSEELINVSLQVTALAPHHVCSSAPHRVPGTLPRMALASLDTTETSSSAARNWP